MPTRWWLPLSGTALPSPISPQHTHAALASWLDPLNAAMTASDPMEEHGSTLKPWFTSPVSMRVDGSLGIEVSALTDAVSELVYAGPPRDELRLGRQILATGTPSEISSATWGDLAVSTEQRRWTIAFLTPTCFRMRSSSSVSPLPAAEPILRGLDNYWTAFSGSDSRLGGHESPGVVVTRCDIQTHMVSIARKGVAKMPSYIPGFVGELTFEAPSQSATVVGPLFRLIDYVSIGSFARRGLGVARVIPAGKEISDGGRTTQTGRRRRDSARVPGDSSWGPGSDTREVRRGPLPPVRITRRSLGR